MWYLVYAHNVLIRYMWYFGTMHSNMVCSNTHNVLVRVRSPGPAVLTSSEYLQPNEWTTVRVERHRQDGTLIINGGIAVKGTANSTRLRPTHTCQLGLFPLPPPPVHVSSSCSQLFTVSYSFTKCLLRVAFNLQRGCC